MEIEAAAGLIQIKKLKNFLNIRNKNSKIFKKLFKNKSWCEIQEEENLSKSSWYGFNIILRNQLKNRRNEIIRKLIKNNVDVRPTMTGNFTNNPVIKFLDYSVSGKLTNSNYVEKNGFFINIMEESFMFAEKLFFLTIGCC